MTSSNDPLAQLAQSLTGDYNQYAYDQHQAGIAHCQQRIAHVPEVTELVLTPRVRRLAVVMAVMFFAFGLMSLAGEKARFMGPVMWLVSLAFVLSYWQHRDAGKQVLLRLTRTHLWFCGLEAPVALRDITQAHIRDGKMMRIHLTLREGAGLPRITNRKGAIMPGATLKRRSGATELRLVAYGFEFDGQVLDAEQLMGMLLAYCDAAQAQAELQSLIAGQAHRR